METRVVHVNQRHDVLIDRTTAWGNPFTHKRSKLAKFSVKNRPEAIEKFRTWVMTSDDKEAVWMREHVHELKGKTLGCWCFPKACHGDVLSALADGEEVSSQESLF